MLASAYAENASATRRYEIRHTLLRRGDPQIRPPLVVDARCLLLV